MKFSDDLESGDGRGRRRTEESLRAIEVQNSILIDEVQRANRLIQVAISEANNAKFNSAIASFIVIIWLVGSLIYYIAM